MRGLSPVAASRGHSPSRRTGLSPSRPLLLRSTGSRRAGPAIVARGPSCSAACGILPDQGSNPCPLHQQADSQPLRHQGSPSSEFLLSLKVSESSIESIREYSMTNETAFHLLDNKICHFCSLVLLVAEVMGYDVSDSAHIN